MSLVAIYYRPFGQSIFLHAAILLVFGVSFVTGSSTHYVLEPATDDVEIIRAISVDQDKVEAEIANIKAQRAAEKAAEQARQQALSQAAEQALHQREAEEQRLSALRESAAADLKAQQERAQLAERELTQLRTQRASEHERLLALEAERELLELQHQQEQAVVQQARQAQIQGEVDRYKALILQAISQEWIIPHDMDPSLSARFEIRLMESGAVTSVRLVQPSGNDALDRSAESAIYQASPLPVPRDVDAFQSFQVLNLTVRPEQILET